MLQNKRCSSWGRYLTRKLSFDSWFVRTKKRVSLDSGYSRRSGFESDAATTQTTLDTDDTRTEIMTCESSVWIKGVREYWNGAVTKHKRYTNRPTWKNSTVIRTHQFSISNCKNITSSTITGADVIKYLLLTILPIEILQQSKSASRTVWNSNTCFHSHLAFCTWFACNSSTM